MSYISKIYRISETSCPECGSPLAEMETTRYIDENGKTEKITKVITCHSCNVCTIILN